MDNNSSIVIYTTKDGQTQLNVTFDKETVWLTQEQIADLFQKAKSTINEHIKNIFADGELDENVVIRKFRTTTQHGAMAGKTQTHEVNFYNLDMILAVGYRVRSQRGIQFRVWASQLIKEYLKKGFVMDDDRLKNLGGGGYWHELLARIRDIRSSEKVFYRQVLEIYATSIDYDPRADVSLNFFKKAQNKIHYAVSGQTAAEIIFDRVDAQKDFMGLTVFKGFQPTLAEAKIAKNYLTKDELDDMNTLVSGYLDFAERQAKRHQPMTMQDWAEHLDKILTMDGDKILQNSGSISHNEAMDKVKTEYQKYQAKTLSEVEQDYLATVKALSKKVEGKL